MLFSCSSTWRAQFRYVLAFAAPIAERSRGQRKLPCQPGLFVEFRHAIHIGKNQAVGPLDMQEHLLRRSLTAGALYDPDLAFLHEIAVLHDLIERLDLECRVQEAIALRWIQRNAVVQSVDAQVSDVADPVADLCAERPPEREIAKVVGGAKPDAMKLDDAGVARREVATPASGRANHQIDR